MIQVCCHVHGVYPYCYIEYKGNLVPDDGIPWHFSVDSFLVDAYIQRLHASIDHSMAIAYRRNPHDPRNNAYVARITLCKGVPMYGYHVGWKFYLKIYLLNPAHMQRLADLLRNGTIMGRQFQPYEVHIPYLLQFMADYGLYGCGWVECKIVTFRSPVPAEQDCVDGPPSVWDESSIPRHLITSSKDKPRLSHCAIEIDLLSHHIRNRRPIKARMLHYDFVERSNPVPLEEKLVHSMAELWRDEERRQARRGENQPVPSMYTSGSRIDVEDGGKGPWIHENEMRAKLEDVIRGERARSDGHALQFESFVKQTKFQSLVQTALESVTDMFPSELPSSSQKKENYVGLNPPSGHLREDSGDFPSAHVDEPRILALLNDMESSTNNAHVGESDYVSESSYESPSEIDFDDDLLGREQKEPQGVLLQRRISSHGQKTPVMNSDILDFSDDLDVDFDVSPSPTGSRFNPKTQSSSNIERAREGYSFNGQNIESPSSAKDAEPLRLRGGASTPELKARKRERNSSSVFPTRKRMRFLEQIIDGPGDRNGIGNSSIDLPPTSGTATNIFAMPGRYSSTPLHNGDGLENSDPGYEIQLSAASLHSATQSAKLPHKPREFTWRKIPPSTGAIFSTLRSLHVPRVLPRLAYYSKNEDVPGATREYGGREFRLVSDSLPFLGTFDCGYKFIGSIFLEKFRAFLDSGRSSKVWQFERRPPLYDVLMCNASEAGLQPGLILDL